MFKITLLDCLDSLACAYSEGDHLSTSSYYQEAIKEEPKLQEIWEDYQNKIEEAKIMFEHRFNKLIKKHGGDECFI